MKKSIHKTIKKVSEDYEHLKANTAIAALMSLTNEFNSFGKISRKDFRTFLMLLNPVAPHITEELWSANKLGGYLNESKWPIYDKSKTVDDEIEIPVQFNGKVRYTVKITQYATQDEVKKVVEEDENYKTQIEGKQVIKRNLCA